MLVTNTTSHTYVLNTASPSVVVIVEAGVVDQLVSDALYVNDSVFNARFDQMVAGGILTVTGQPTDPSPVSNDGGSAESPMVLTANGTDETPLTLVQLAEQVASPFKVVDSDGNLFMEFDSVCDLLVYSQEFLTATMQVLGVDTDQYTELQPGGLLARALADQSWSLLNLEVASGNTAFSVEPDGSTYVHSRDAAVIPLTILAAAAQSADLLQVKDANNALVFSVRADGTIHAKTGGSIHFDL